MTSIVNSAMKPVIKEVTDMKNALEVRNGTIVIPSHGTFSKI